MSRRKQSHMGNEHTNSFIMQIGYPTLTDVMMMCATYKMGSHFVSMMMMIGAQYILKMVPLKLITHFVSFFFRFYMYK